MKDVILVGAQGNIIEKPADMFYEHLEHARQHPSERLAFMSAEHHLVRNFAVSELPRNNGKPLRAEYIAQQLQLPLADVKALLDDLQKHLFFLVLNSAGEVSWAFPVTSEKTPHKLRFSGGEQAFAA